MAFQQGGHLSCQQADYKGQFGLVGGIDASETEGYIWFMKLQNHWQFPLNHWGMVLQAPFRDKALHIAFTAQYSQW